MVYIQCRHIILKVTYKPMMARCYLTCQWCHYFEILESCPIKKENGIKSEKKKPRKKQELSSSGMGNIPSPMKSYIISCETCVTLNNTVWSGICWPSLWLYTEQSEGSKDFHAQGFSQECMSFTAGYHQTSSNMQAYITNPDSMTM